MFVRIIAFIATLAAFVLPLLLLLSGRTPSYLPPLHIIELNTSHLMPASTIDDAIADTGIPFLDDLADSVSSSASDTVNAVADRLGVHDFYTAHLLTYCWGEEQDVTGCDGQHVPFEFDPIPILETDLVDDVTLENLGFPVDDVKDKMRILKTVYKVMGIFVLVATILAGVSVLVGIWGLFGGRLSAALLGTLMGIAALLLIVAAVMATIIAIKVRDVLNRELDDVGITADESRDFLGVMWGAVAAALLATTVWGLGCCMGGRKHSKRDSIGDEGLVGGRRRRRGWRM